MSARNSTVASPCVGLCNVFDGICTGCFRDMDEISDWHEMSAEQRLKLLAELEQRSKEAEAVERN